MNLRINGGLTKTERQRINSITDSDKSYFMKYQLLMDMNLLKDPTFTDVFDGQMYSSVIRNIANKHRQQESLENTEYSKEVAIVVDNVDDLFGEEFELLLERHDVNPFKNERPRKRKKVSAANCKNIGCNGFPKPKKRLSIQYQLIVNLLEK